MQLLNDVVIATHNPDKFAELQALCSPFCRSLSAQYEHFSDSIPETGNSYLENALLKARFASHKTGYGAIADDSGLSIDYLDGAPGIYSARFSNGEHSTSEDNVQKVLSQLTDVPFAQRGAYYISCVVYVRHAHDPEPIIGLGKWYGEILTEVRTTYGIGYDAIFWDYNRCKAASEMDINLKNSISHRYKAIEMLKTQLQEQC